MDKEADPLLVSRRYTLWQLIHTYWQSDQRFIASVALFIFMFMTIGLVGLDVIFSYWYNHFYNALQAYDKHATVRLLVVFCVLAAFYIVVAVYRFYVSQMFGLRWRKWLTNQIVARWLQKQGYYKLETFDVNTDNPDQRIQEDIGSLVSYSIDLSMGVVSSIATFFAFIYILWQLSGPLNVSLGRFGTLHIAGYLVWVSLLYAFIGTFFTLKIGRPLVPLNFEQQRREATFRYAAVDLRTHAEHVALYKGEEHQKGVLNRLFTRVLDNWYGIILRQRVILWFTSGYNQVSVLLPLLVALPNYFEKVFLLGGLIQTLNAFGKVQDALSFLVNSYPRIAEWQAVAQRLTTFINHMQDIDETVARETKLVRRYQEKNQIDIANLAIFTPRGEKLLENINEQLIGGRNYLIQGPSGIGKSTFVRTVAGIWPYASGTILLPQDLSIMYLPQRPYMPIGTLKEAILFPEDERHDSEARVTQVLQACHLDQFIPRLNESARWSEQFSLGEQQRIAFARILLHKPDWVFLDESTSSLDIASEKAVYEVLKVTLPTCSVVSVGHRPSLVAYHEETVDLSKY